MSLTTVPAPTSCGTCHGDGVVGTSHCPDCRCVICGQPTDTPPECGSCYLDNDDLQRRRADQ